MVKTFCLDVLGKSNSVVCSVYVDADLALSISHQVINGTEMKNMINFGLMTACCIILALGATFLLAPALMMLTNKTWHRQNESLNKEPDAEPILG